MNIQKIGGVTVLSTDGRLDSPVGHELRDAIMKLSKESGLKLVVDMGKTTYIDSSGCGWLVISLKALRENNGEMKIARPNPQVTFLLQLIRLHKVFQIYDSVESAVESYA